MGDTGFFSTTIWLNVTSLLALFYAIYISSLSNEKLLYQKQNNVFSIIILIISIIYIGTRPIWCYADTYGYTYIYNAVKFGYWSELPPYEILWAAIENLCINFTNASEWLFIIASLYIIPKGIALNRIFPKHSLLAIIFLITSFLFWGYATNTIRHGVATSFAMLGISYLIGNKRKYIIGYLFFIFAILTHKSTLLILSSATIAMFYKKTNVYLTIWLICILLGLLFNDFFKSYFSFLIEDEKFLYYTNMAQNKNIYDTSFRWDFIIYSAIPVALGWFIIVKKKIIDESYGLILNTYIISNSFWILINTTAYSDRFAYLSWFLFPILIIYPFCKFKLFKNQSSILGLILIIQIIFTYYMI